MATKLLIGVPPKAHVSLAQDEVDALRNLGYLCDTIAYGRNDQNVGVLNKILFTASNAFKIVGRLYKTNPAILYLNSRFEPAGSTRDFISLFIIRLLYWKRLAVVIKSHGSNHAVLTNSSAWYGKILIPFLRAQVQAWFFLSGEEKKLVEQQDAVLAAKIHVVPNIIDPSRCVPDQHFREQYQLPGDKFLVLFVGRMVKVKGIFDIVNSIPLMQCGPQMAFVMVGNGDDFEAIKKQVADLHLQRQVFFPGYLPDAECDHFYANADALVFPTYDTEGFPMALFKSVAVGLPVITTRIRAAKDHLKEPSNVLWVKEQSPKNIAAAIDRLYMDQSLQHSMKENNISLGKRFSGEAVAHTMSQVFTQLLNNDEA